MGIKKTPGMMIYLGTWRIFKVFIRITEFITKSASAALSGFWLGMLKRKTINDLGEVYYTSLGTYQSKDFNENGLFEFEREAVKRYFDSCSTILVAGAGGGREMLPLLEKGFDVDGFECNPVFVAFADSLFKKRGFPKSMMFAPPDCCPPVDKQYDGLIIGWGVYTCIKGRRKRIDFLKQIHSFVKPEAPILLSFHFRAKARNRRYVVIRRLGNLLRHISGADPVEEGDDFFFHPPTTKGAFFVHDFTREEIEAELNETGFEMIHFSPDYYAHAVGRARRIPDSS